MASIYKNKFGVWQIQYMLNHKKVIQSLKTKDKEIAKKVKKKMEAELELQMHNLAARKINLSDAIKKYRKYKKLTLKESSFQRLEYVLKQISEWADSQNITTTNQINTGEVEHFYSYLKNKDYSKRTIAMNIQTLKAIFNLLWEHRLIHEIPIRKWPAIGKITTKHKERIGKYSPDEVRKLVAYFKKNENGDSFYEAFTFLIYTGARKKEMLELKVHDVNLEENSIKLMNWKTADKYENEYRIVPILNDKLKIILQSRIKDAQPDDYVFDFERKRTGSWMRKRMERACKILKIQYRRLHGTRHTFISYLLNDLNLPLKKVMDIVGHNLPETTMRYSHVSKESLIGIDGKVEY